jgi:hypothetical protein
MVAAMRVKSPFSHKALLGFAAGVCVLVDLSISFVFEVKNGALNC